MIIIISGCDRYIIRWLRSKAASVESVWIYYSRTVRLTAKVFWQLAVLAAGLPNHNHVLVEWFHIWIADIRLTQTF